MVAPARRTSKEAYAYLVASARRFFAQRARGPGRRRQPRAPHAAQAVGDLGQHVALQVDSTALGDLGQEAAHRSCQARVLIRDHELDAAETTVQELLEELRPAVLRLLRERDAQEPGGRRGPTA